MKDTKKLSMFNERSRFNYNKAMRLTELIDSDKDVRQDKSLHDAKDFVNAALSIKPQFLSKIAMVKLKAAQTIDADINLFCNDKENRLMTDEQFDKITDYTREIESRQELLYTDKYFEDSRIKSFTIYTDEEDYLHDQLTDDERFSTGSSKFLAGVKPGAKVDALLDDKLRSKTDDLFNLLEIEEIGSDE